MTKLWILCIFLAYVDSTEQHMARVFQGRDVSKVLNQTPAKAIMNHENMASEKLLSSKSKLSSTSDIKPNLESGFADSKDQNRLLEYQEIDISELLNQTPAMPSLNYKEIASKEVLSLKSKGIKPKSEKGYLPPALGKENEKVKDFSLQEPLRFDKRIKTDDKITYKRLAFRLKVSPNEIFEIEKVDLEMRQEKYFFTVHVSRNNIEKNAKTRGSDPQVHVWIDKIWRIYDKEPEDLENLEKASKKHFVFYVNEDSHVGDLESMTKRGEYTELPSGNSLSNEINSVVNVVGNLKDMWKAPVENFVFILREDTPVDDASNKTARGEVPKQVKNGRIKILIGVADVESPFKGEINHKKTVQTSRIFKPLNVFIITFLLLGFFFLLKFFKIVFSKKFKTDASNEVLLKA